MDINRNTARVGSSLRNLGWLGLVVLGLLVITVLAIWLIMIGRPQDTAIVEPDALLVVAEDFPSGGLQQTQRFGQQETNDGGRAAETTLTGDGFEVFHTVVVFPADSDAHAAFQSIAENGVGGGWTIPEQAPVFGHESVVLTGQLGPRQAVSAVFRRGSVFERIVLVGTNDVAKIEPYARKADEKVELRF